MCLEEMLGVTIPEGAIFYGKPRRRERVVFEKVLRVLVEKACGDMHAMIEAGEVPPAEVGKRCRGCSLAGACMPGASARVESYLLKGLE
jgi:CRISPR-associated exonuclease Cas4